MTIADDIADYVEKGAGALGRKVQQGANAICLVMFDSPDRCDRESPPTQPNPFAPIDPISDAPINPNSSQNAPKSNANRPPVYSPPVLPSPEIPDRKLPKEADGQTDYDSPNGKSISLQTALKEREYGRLLWNPFGNKKLSIKKADYGDLAGKIKEKQEKGSAQFDKWLNGEQISFSEKAAFFSPSKLDGFSGVMGLNFGLEILGDIATVYRGESRNALLEVHDNIPKQFEAKNFTPKSDRYFIPSQGVECCSLGKMEQVLAPDQFPGELPHLLNIERKDEKPEDRKVKNYPELFLWFIKEFDSIFGEFPIAIEIEDADLTEEGKQTKTLKIANLAEGISELFGLAFNGATIHDANLNILLRFIPEILRIRQLSVTTQDICIANRDFLGYREKEVKKEIESQFSVLKNFDNLAKLLKPENQKYKSIEFDGKQNLMDILLRLQFVAGLQKAALVNTTEEIENFVNQLEGNDNNKLDDWNQFVSIINDPTSQFNFGEKPSKVRDVEGD